MFTVEPLICPFAECSREFSTEEGWTNHIEHVHPERTCNYCGFSSLDSTLFDNHTLLKQHQDAMKAYRNIPMTERISNNFNTLPTINDDNNNNATITENNTYDDDDYIEVCTIKLRFLS
jgi:hypothetical protein